MLSTMTDQGSWTLTGNPSLDHVLFLLTGILLAHGLRQGLIQFGHYWPSFQAGFRRLWAGLQESLPFFEGMESHV